MEYLPIDSGTEQCLQLQLLGALVEEKVEETEVMDGLEIGGGHGVGLPLFKSCDLNWDWGGGGLHGIDLWDGGPKLTHFWREVGGQQTQDQQEIRRIPNCIVCP